MLSLFTTLMHFTIDLPRRIEEGGEDTEAFTLSDLSSQGKIRDFVSYQHNGSQEKQRRDRKVKKRKRKKVMQVGLEGIGGSKSDETDEGNEGGSMKRVL